MGIGVGYLAQVDSCLLSQTPPEFLLTLGDLIADVATLRLVYFGLSFDSPDFTCHEHDRA